MAVVLPYFILLTSGEDKIDQQRKDLAGKMLPSDFLMLVAVSFSSFDFDAAFFSLKIGNVHEFTMVSRFTFLLVMK